MNEHDGVLIRRAAPGEVIDLRHAVLRQGLARAEAIFAGDDDATSRHYGAFRDDELLCCATLHLNQWEAEPAWQLRGMATAPHARRQGIGRRVLDFMERDLRDAAARDGTTLMLWCNARTPALEFYRGMGWRVVSGVFEIPTAGPHVRMTKRLTP